MAIERGPHEVEHHALDLVRELGIALERAEVSYCQWKGQRKVHRWGTGAGDIDLLIDRASGARFDETLGRLGFKRLRPPEGHELAGVTSHFGLDGRTGTLVHVHAYQRLIVGSPRTTSYHLPLEASLLASAAPAVVFRRPAAELELLVFLLRMVQRIRVSTSLLGRTPAWLAEIQPELDDLSAGADAGSLAVRLASRIPGVDAPFLLRCLRGLRPGYAPWRRALLRRELHRRLSPFAAGPSIVARIVDRLRRAARRASGIRAPMGGFAGGGLVVGLVGGDGAGKSTCAHELRRWLSRYADAETMHLGRPPRSLLTLAVGALVRIRIRLGLVLGDRIARMAAADEPTTFPGYLRFLRYVCTARDRYLLHRRAWRRATAGAVVVCERYPVEQASSMAGPRIGEFLAATPNRRLGRMLARAERRYYDRMARPDLLLVLLVEPEQAVRRKTSEPPDYVRARARLMRDADWSAAGARVIDAGRPLSCVIRDLQVQIWSAL
jgi:thymidylate kinase